MKKFMNILFITIFYLMACSHSERNAKTNLSKEQQMNDTLITSKNFVEKVAQNVKKI